MTPRSAVSNHITVLGGGAFGTALAHILCEHNNVTLWSRNESVVQEINHNHTNRQYLPNVKLNPSLRATGHIAASPGSTVVIAVPSFAADSVIGQLEPGNYKFLIASKGLDPATGNTVEQLCHGHHPNGTTAVMAGPNYAAELASGQPSIAVLACKGPSMRGEHDVNDGSSAVNGPICDHHIKLFRGTNLKFVVSADTVGLQMASSYKHIAAICGGICDALSQNARQFNLKGYILYHYFQELQNLIVNRGGDPLTMYLGPVLGDLFISCHSASRNHMLGYLAVTDQNCEKYKKFQKICEGMHVISTLHSHYERARKLPLLNLLYRFMHERSIKSPEMLREAMENLHCSTA